MVSALESPIKQATFEFYGSLIDFLSFDKKDRPIQVSFRNGQSVKHLIESLRVPHTDVGRIIVNDTIVDFSYLVEDNDQVCVYPVDNVYPGHLKNVNRELINTPCFVLDNHLGRLARYLRMLGFDAWYRNDYQDDELARIAEYGERILLTRDRGLLMRKVVKYGYCIRTKDPKKQLVEVVERFNLQGKIEPFKRCLVCNSSLEPVAKEDIIGRLRPLTKKYYSEFRICPQCNRIYWKGSHYEHMDQFLRKVIDKPDDSKLIVS
jgi:uncharacterized protein with PIN domain